MSSTITTTTVTMMTTAITLEGLMASLTLTAILMIALIVVIYGLSVPTIYRLMSRNKFPRPVKITNTARAWRLSEVTAWVDSREREDVS